MSMRLINTATLQMKVFTGDKIPRYAILSHTWAEDSEVDFREMTDIAGSLANPARQKSGYHKTLRACEVARTDGTEHIWIDTCCIDKSSSAELSEAINSMFKWYKGAEVCYAYICDLAFGRNTKTSFGSCSYWTRSWTLQEMIAPELVQFYDMGWNFVGTRDSLIGAIKHITGIEEDVLLRKKPLSEVLIAVKMSWASRRMSTREEDIAYCLLGIFDVNMPLLYGEGQKAFLRLQEEIMKRSDDLSIFWNFTSSTPSTVAECQLGVIGPSAKSSSGSELAWTQPSPLSKEEDRYIKRPHQRRCPV
ncbi:hypothetical protein H2200_010942 [Cladophialophora chaetospira]|uniref:Heterokaryon incompatibility domain-containing protein n=1 Tax=Cladophialophora chaetospira TaxID=386627 RepID=A0AA38X120_9EURO|nr:hypothetical protein H2200_010942 [Cladophialophora chaetospira]